jgi:hypothetical protein
VCGTEERYECLAPQPADGRAERPDKPPPDGSERSGEGGRDSSRPVRVWRARQDLGRLTSRVRSESRGSRRVRHLFGPWRIRRRRVRLLVIWRGRFSWRLAGR